ncbi:MAG: hypothetical protein CML34_01525 [Rhodobacteraceae bacterium]|jgi:hypothetical protein|nr:hypothetical protein [Paracoccaceae bacterium]
MNNLEYIINNWQPLLLVLLGLLAGTIILHVSERIFNIFGPKIRRIIFRLLFYVIILIIMTKYLALW